VTHCTSVIPSLAALADVMDSWGDEQQVGMSLYGTESQPLTEVQSIQAVYLETHFIGCPPSKRSTQ
jgi:hypothetical protein